MLKAWSTISLPPKGAQHDDRVRHARLARDVSVNPLQEAVAAQVVQDAVAAEPVVRDADRPPASLSQAPRQIRARAVTLSTAASGTHHLVRT